MHSFTFRFTVVIAFIHIWMVNPFAQDHGLYEISTEVDIHEDEGLHFIDEYIEGKNIVLTGENHRFYGSNQLIKLKFLLHLYEQGFRNYVLEFGSGIGYLFNDYVVNGNEKAYKIIEQSFDDGYMPYKYFLNILRDFNKDKPLEEKIQIRGVDYTRYPFFTLKALALIIEEMGCQDELKDYYEDLNVVSTGSPNIDPSGFFVRRTPENFNLRAGFKTYRNRIFELSIRNLIQDFERDTARFVLALGPKYPLFEELMMDIKATLEWYKGEGVRIQSHIQRERYMTRNIARIIEADSSAKVYGQFGRCHVRNENYSQDCYGFDLLSISERLEKMDTSLFAVKSIPIFYVEERVIESNRAVTGMRTAKLLPVARVYFYKDESNALLFTESDYRLDDVAIINTFSSNAELEDVLESREVKYPSRLAYYDGTDTEDLFSVIASYADIGRDFNENFGVDFYSPHNISYGLDLRSVMNTGGQSLLRFTMLHPMNFNSDSLELRYTNYRFQFGGGYNFVHNRVFSMYSDLSLFFGFAKFRERRAPAEQVYSFPVKSEQVNYRNPYIGAALSLGTRIKFRDVSLFLESAYQRDFSNTNWRVRGSQVVGIDPLNFSNFLFFAGLSISY